MSYRTQNLTLLQKALADLQASAAGSTAESDQKYSAAMELIGKITRIADWNARINWLDAHYPDWRGYQIQGSLDEETLEDLKAMLRFQVPDRPVFEELTVAQHLVLDAIAQGCQTIPEVCQALGLLRGSIRPCVDVLQALGYIEHTGTTRSHRARRPANAYRIKIADYARTA